MDNNYTLYILADNTSEYHLLDIETSQMTTQFNLENIQDITKRMDTYSQDVVLKGTDRNNEALGNLYDISRYSSEDYAQELAHNFTANKAVKCILLENNIQIVKGSLLIRNINIDEGKITYDAAITGSLVSFFIDLKERFLHELDSIDVSVVYNMSNIIASWNYFNNNIVATFPHLDYGIDDRPIVKMNLGQEDEFEVIPDWWDSSYDLKNHRPCVYLNKYIEAIFKGFRYDEVNKKYTQFTTEGDKLNNYTYTSSFFGEDHFKKIFLPHNEQHLTKNITGEWATLSTGGMSYAGTGELAPTLIGSILDTNANSEYFDYYRSGEWEFWKDDGRGFSASNVPILRFKDTYLNSSLSLTMTVRMPADFQGEYLVGMCDISQDNRITSANMKFAQKVTKVAGSAQTFNININQDTTNIAGEWVIALYRENDQSSDHTNGDGTGVVFSGATIKLGKANAISQVPYSLDDTIKIFDTIPKDVKLQDFLKSILTLFNLYMVIDPNNDRNFIIEPYNEFYKDVIDLTVNDGQANGNKAIDWTNKIDFKNYKLSTNIMLPRSYTYKFGEDGDMLNEYYESINTSSQYGQLTINDSKGTGEAKELEVIFAPTLTYNTASNSKKLAVLHKGAFLQGKKEPMKTKLRLLYFNGIENSGANYDTYYRNEVVYRGTAYAPASMFFYNLDGIATDTLLFDLPLLFLTTTNNAVDVIADYSITTYEKYHKQQIADLLDSNILIMEAKGYLSENDISQLDFRKPIFIQSQYGNGYFKLLSIEYTNSNTPSAIKLQKIIK